MRAARSDLFERLLPFGYDSSGTEGLYSSLGDHSTGLVHGSHPSPVDEATRKEFEDLQVEHARAAREHGAVQAQLMSPQREDKLAELTRNDLEDVSEATKVLARRFCGPGRTRAKLWSTWISKCRISQSGHNHQFSDDLAFKYYR
jgi:hypothetical protein